MFSSLEICFEPSDLKRSGWNSYGASQSNTYNEVQPSGGSPFVKRSGAVETPRNILCAFWLWFWLCSGAFWVNLLRSLRPEYLLTSSIILCPSYWLVLALGLCPLYFLILFLLGSAPYVYWLPSLDSWNLFFHSCKKKKERLKEYWGTDGSCKKKGMRRMYRIARS